MRINCDSIGPKKLTVTSTRCTPFGNEITIFVKLLNAMVVKICHQQIVVTVDCQSSRFPTQSAIWRWLITITAAKFAGNRVVAIDLNNAAVA